MPVRIVAWPHYPGRAELIRLYLEDRGHPYQDVAREKGVTRIPEELADRGSDLLPYDVPVILDDLERVTHVPNILLYLMDRYDPETAAAVDRYQLNALVMTVMNCIDALHRAHHPLDPREDYEPHKHIAFPISAWFRERQLDRYLFWMEEAAGRLQGPWMFGETFTYGDLVVSHTIRGLRHCYRKRMAAREGKTPHLDALITAVEARPAIQEYRASERWLPFNHFGVFRYYRELDQP